MLENQPKPFPETLAERTLFYSEYRDENKPNLLFVSSDRGSGNAVEPVAQAARQDTNVYVGAADASQVVWQSWGESSKIDPHNLVTTVKPSVVIAGCSYRPGIERSVTRQAKKAGVGVVWVMDMFGGISFKHLSQPHAGVEIRPDFVAVMDEPTRQYVMAVRPDIKAENIVVTGQPAFDSLSQVLLDKESQREKIRTQLGIDSEDKLILFAGQLKGTAETLVSVVDAMRKMPPSVKLIFRRHPLDETLLEDYEEIFQSIPGRVVDSSQINKIETVISAVDLTVSLYSTVNLTSIHLQIPTLYVLANEPAQAALYNINPLGLLPPVEVGAALAVYEEKEIANQLDAFIFDEVAQAKMKQQQRKHYFPDGKNAERVMQLVKSMIK